MERKILLADLEPSVSAFLSPILISAGYSVNIENDSKKIEYVLTESNFSLVITSVESNLLEQINIYDDRIIFWAICDQKHLHKKSEYLAMGVNDFLLRPLKISRLVNRLSTVFLYDEDGRLSKLNNLLIAEKRKRQTNDVFWFNNSFDNKDDFFYNLHTAFNQGAGFGSLFSLLEIMEQTAQKKDDKYEVDSSLYDMITENRKFASKALTVIKEIDQISYQQIQFQEMNISEFVSLMKSWLEELTETLYIKQQTVIFEEVSNEVAFKSIKLNSELFQKAFNELITNACKNSITGAPIVILIDKDEFGDDYLNLNIVNYPDDIHERIGVPEDKENTIFEPFSRLDKTVQESYKSLEFGIGLSLVKRIIEVHQGFIKIFNVQDIEKEQTVVFASIVFKIV